MSNPLILLPFLEEQNPQLTSLVYRQVINGLNGQPNKTTFQTLASVSGKGYIDRAILAAYWSMYAGQWMRFRIIADGVTILDQTSDATQQTYAYFGMGVSHLKYLDARYDASATATENFPIPLFNVSSQYYSTVPARPTNGLQVGIPSVVSGSVGSGDAGFGVTPIAEPIYFNSSLQIQVSMASGGSMQGAILITGGMI